MIRAARVALAGAVMLVACDASVRLGAIASSNEPLPDSGGADGAVSADATPSDSCGADCACGRSCLGGACIAGRCTAAELATGMGGAEWIAVGPEHVTWSVTARAAFPTDVNAHYVARKDGTEQNRIRFENGSYRGVLADEPTFHAIRWVLSTNPGPGAPIGVALIERATATTGLSPQVSGVFIESFGIAQDTTDLFVASTTKVVRTVKTAQGGQATQLPPVFTKAITLAVDDTAIYVADAGAQAIVRLDKVTGTLTWTVPVAATVNDVAIDATHVYFAGGDRAGRIAKDGTGLDAFTLPGASAVAVDASGVYFTTATDLRRANATTLAATTLVASGFNALGRVALDETAIYFTDRGAGIVYRLAK